MKIFVGLVLFFAASMAHADQISAKGLAAINANQGMEKCDKLFKDSKLKPGAVIVEIKIDKKGEVIDKKTDIQNSSIHKQKVHGCILKNMPARFATDVNGTDRSLTATIKFPR